MTKVVLTITEGLTNNGAFGDVFGHNQRTRHWLESQVKQKANVGG